MIRGVILAGGTGKRLFPLTKVTNKHLLPVGKEPMIFNPIRRLVECGIKEICIVTSTQHMGDIVNLLGSGEEMGVDFTYKVQEKPGGIAQALSLTENFANSGKIVVILGDNILTDSIKEHVENFKNQKKGAKILLKEVGDPERYGVAATDEPGRVLNIQEKPNNPESNLAVIGVYMYDNQVYSIIKKQSPSDRNEYEITDVNNEYIKLNQLESDIYQGGWTDAGTFDSLKDANRMLLELEHKRGE